MRYVIGTLELEGDICLSDKLSVSSSIGQWPDFWIMQMSTKKLLCWRHISRACVIISTHSKIISNSKHTLSSWRSCDMLFCKGEMKQYSLIEWRVEKQWNHPASQFDFTSTPIWLFNYAEVTIQRSNNVQMSNWFTGKYSQLKNDTK